MISNRFSRQSGFVVWFIAIMLIVLCLFSLSACGKSDDSTQQAGTSDAAVNTEQNSSAASSTESTTAEDNDTDSTSSDAAKDNDADNSPKSDAADTADTADSDDAAAALTDILTDLSQKYHMGVAGSSMTAVSFAAQLLDWAANTDNAAGIAEDTAAEFTASLDEKAKSDFPKQIAAIYDVAQDLCSDDGQSLLQGCGYEATSYPWDAESMEELFSALLNN